MKASELGEFGLIELLASIVNRAKTTSDASWQNLLIGIGDDAAAWRGDSSIQLATVDTLVEGVHFHRKIITDEELGWKALAVNLSDIAAMGGVPKYALVSLALPGDLEVEAISALYQGMVNLAQEFRVVIAGGDVISAPSLIITITVFGSLEDKDKSPLTRSAAMPDDQVAVTGFLGTSAAGLKMLMEGLNWDEETTTLVKQAHLRPTPKIKEGQVLLQSGVKTAIDISDGLISDLSQICKLSRVGAKIRLDSLPVHHLVRAALNNSWMELALSGGEDYELLFTANNSVIDRVKEALTCPVTVIGEITRETPGEVTVIDKSGKTIPCRQAGWEHFKSQPLRK